MDENANPFAVGAAKGRTSANKAYDLFHEAGGQMRRADFLALVRGIREELQNQTLGYDRRGDRRPYRREIGFLYAATGGGFIQYVDVWVKNHETGEIYPRPYGLKVDDLLPHDDVIETALDRYSQHAEGYGETILGASYMATYEIVPGPPPPGSSKFVGI